MKHSRQKMKYKVLSIVPYLGLENQIISINHDISKDYPYIDLNFNFNKANLANPSTIVNLVKQNEFDLILSRGGTATLLRTITSKPVVDISFSQYDLLRTIHMVSDLKSTVIICYQALANKIRRALEEFNIELDIYTLDQNTDSKILLKKLYALGYKNIICDSNNLEAVNKYHFNTFLITSGSERIKEALRLCYIYCNKNQPFLDQINLLKRGISFLTDKYLILNSQRQIIFTNLSIPKDKLRHRINTLSNPKINTIKLNNNNYRIKRERAQQYIFIFLNKNVVSKLDTNKYPNQYIKDIFDNIYSDNFYSLLSLYSKNKSPIAFIGEQGLLRNYLFKLVSRYAQIKTTNVKFINFKKDEDVKHQISNLNSILFNNDQEIVFNGLEKISLNMQKELWDFCRKSQLINRNLIIFNIIKKNNAHGEIEFPSDLNIKTLFLKPLNDVNYDTLSAIMSALINDFDLLNGTTITNVADTARDLLSSYNWPNNYDEFLEVFLNSLTISKKPIVSSEIIENNLNQARKQDEYQSNYIQSHVKEDKSLNKKIMNYINEVLAENNGNKSKTARDLKISRATLWRYLNKK